jgi:hypothetical protein
VSLSKKARERARSGPQWDFRTVDNLRMREDLVAILVDREEQARLDCLLDCEYDRVAADFYQLPPRG